jgi:predicted DCC family thiol-disulfide oxidoreductase YuxK
VSGPRGEEGKAPPKLFVVYDGECNLCLATAAKLQQIDTVSTLEWVTLQSLISGETKPWPAIAGVEPAQLAARMHVTDEQGRVFEGADAVLRLLRDVPSLRWLGIVGEWPGFRGVSRWLYRLVARYRYQLFGKNESCADGVCTLPRTKPSDGGK